LDGGVSVCFGAVAQLAIAIPFRLPTSGAVAAVLARFFVAIIEK